MDCYNCKHRGAIAGDTHSSCQHPLANKNTAIDAITLLVSGYSPLESVMGVELNPHGVKSGWCMFPINFDPIWVVNCDSFEKINSLHK